MSPGSGSDSTRKNCLVLAVQSRVDRVEHEVYEHEVITAVGLTRVGETAELESGPSILPLRVLILPRFSQYFA